MHPERNHLWKRFWKRFGGGLGAHFGPKIDLGSDLKSRCKRKRVLIPLRARFGTPFKRFLKPPGQSMARNKRQEDDSIAEPPKASKPEWLGREARWLTLLTWVKLGLNVVHTWYKRGPSVA